MKVITTGPEVFRSGQVAKICKVSLGTVHRWSDSGQLKGYRLSGLGHRRYLKKDLIEFLEKKGMPFDDLLDKVFYQILIVTRDQVLIENLNDKIKPEHFFEIIHFFEVMVAASGFDAGLQTEEFQPDCIIVDFSIGSAEASRICQSVRRKNNKVILVALLPDVDTSYNLDHLGINGTFKKPLNPAILIKRLKRLISKKKQLS